MHARLAAIAVREGMAVVQAGDKALARTQRQQPAVTRGHADRRAQVDDQNGVQGWHLPPRQRAGVFPVIRVAGHEGN